MKLWFTVLLLLALSACSSRYQHKNDFTPPEHPDPTSVAEPTPKQEPMAVMGNGPTYKVLGKQYTVMDNPTVFNQSGIASWYGMKFHGHATSSGEIYDVYQYTAAHKTLPLPSYVRVTRTDNGKSVVVRVNDRGPFHEGRVIDLSYIAAMKIGLDKDGTAPVKVELLMPPGNEKVRWVQVYALSDKERANQQVADLQQSLKPLAWPVELHSEMQNQKMLHKVRIGPVPDGTDLQQVLQRLREMGINKPVILASHQLDGSKVLK